MNAAEKHSSNHNKHHTPHPLEWIQQKVWLQCGDI